MEKKWTKFRIIAGMCAALGWWGLLYPELALTPDTVKVIYIDQEGREQLLPSEWSFDDDLYLELLEADPDKIHFRSKLLTSLQSLWEAFQHGNH